MISTNELALLGLTAAVAWGISDYYAARATKLMEPLVAAAIINILGSLLFFAIYLVFFRNYREISLTGFWYAIAASVVLSSSAATFFIALKAGPVSIVSPLSSTYPLVTAVLALLFFKAPLSTQVISGIVITVTGVLVASGLFSDRSAGFRLAKGPLFALLAALQWGFGYAILAQALRRGDWQVVSLISFIFVLLFFSLVLLYFRFSGKITWRHTISSINSRYVLGASAIQMIGIVAIDIGIYHSTTTNGAVVTALSATYPLLTVFLALRQLKERVPVIPLIGGFVGIIGVITLTLS